MWLTSGLRSRLSRHQTITDFEHAVTAKHLRRGRADLLRPLPATEQVEIRSLGVYDQALGVVDQFTDEEVS